MSGSSFIPVKLTICDIKGKYFFLVFVPLILSVLILPTNILISILSLNIFISAFL